ncbi:TPA: hypothetical protein L4G82_006185 [Pseudomonas aeruginosa]|nr:hypothetical protein [Pseudomonas aeruginosa]HBO2235004.1 hypothetical protein [Pseudomonas aeruginosa]
MVIADGTIEALKWLALLAMTGDHVNKYLFNGTLPYLFEAGRLALPLFVFVLAYNLARPGALERGLYGRAMKRLLAFGLVASVPFIALGGVVGGWWPLNVMFTLLAATAMLYLVERGRSVAPIALFVVAGGLVDAIAQEMHHRGPAAARPVRLRTAEHPHADAARFDPAGNADRASGANLPRR